MAFLKVTASWEKDVECMFSDRKHSHCMIVLTANLQFRIEIEESVIVFIIEIHVILPCTRMSEAQESR